MAKAELKLPVTTTLGPNTLLLWRDRMGYSQRDACDQLGCSRGALGKWETGRKPVPLYIALACAALAVGMKPYGDENAAAPDKLRA